MDTDDDAVRDMYTARRERQQQGALRTLTAPFRVAATTCSFAMCAKSTAGTSLRATTALTSSPTCIPTLWTISDPELAAGEEEGPLRCPQLARQSTIQPDGYPDDSTDQSSSAAQQPISERS